MQVQQPPGQGPHRGGRGKAPRAGPAGVEGHAEHVGIALAHRGENFRRAVLRVVFIGQLHVVFPQKTYEPRAVVPQQAVIAADDPAVERLQEPGQEPQILRRAAPVTRHRRDRHAVPGEHLARELEVPGRRPRRMEVGAPQVEVCKPQRLDAGYEVVEAIGKRLHRPKKIVVGGVPLHPAAGHAVAQGPGDVVGGDERDGVHEQDSGHGARAASVTFRGQRPASVDRTARATAARVVWAVRAADSSVGRALISGSNGSAVTGPS